MLRATLLRASNSPALRALVTGNRVPRAVAMRYVAGETLDDGLAAARDLAAQGFQVTLDHLGEAVTDAGEAKRAADANLEALQRIGAEALPAGLSVKPTALGLGLADDPDAERCLERLDEVATAAAAVGAHLTLDMEGRDVTEATVALVERLRARGHGHVGCAVQTYLRRTADDVRRLTAAGASLRLCKGAYAEPPDVAFTTRVEVDRAYARAASWLLANGAHPRLATHDDRLIARARRDADALGLDPGAFEFQMLYGVREPLQRRLLADGYRVCVYVPYGDQWYPYFMRRLAERPANLVFFLRSLAPSAWQG